MFSEVAAQSGLLEHRELVFAWIDGAKHSKLLKKLMGTELHLPAVILMDSHQHLVYTLDLQGREEDGDVLRTKLVEHLRAFDGGILQPTGIEVYIEPLN